MGRRIRVPEVRVIGADGAQIGVIPTHEALKLAEEAGFELVEVNPRAAPPVCKIMDFGKFKYETSKKEKASRKHQTTVVLKEIKLRPKTDEHDFDFKVKHIRRFLSEGNKCKLVIVFRGREIVHPETGQAMLDSVVKAVSDIAMVEQRPMMEGRRMVMIIGPRGGVIRPASPVTGSGPGPGQGRAARRPHRARRPAAPRRASPAAGQPRAGQRRSRHRSRRRPPSRPPRRRPPPPPRPPEAKPDSSDSAVVCGRDEAPAQPVPGRGARGPGARGDRRRLSPRRLRGRRRRPMRSTGGLPGAGLRRVHGAEAARRADRPERSGAGHGPKALAAEGDYLLENDLIRVVLDAPDHPHFLGPSGGAILDLAPLRQGPSDRRAPAIRSTPSTTPPACSRATPSTTRAPPSSIPSSTRRRPAPTPR